MAGQADEPARDVTANREAWTQINARAAAWSSTR
jgi:hypothetical protein